MNRPKPSSLKKLQGNPGKRRLNELEPQPAIGIADPPEVVKSNAVAFAEWQRVSAELDGKGVIARVDSASLAGYCMSFARWTQAEEHIARYGLVVSSAQGVKKNPACTIAAESLRHMRAFAVEFGLTPASRSRLQVSTTQPEDDALEVFLRRGRELKSKGLN